MELDLALVWALLIAFAILIYVVLDGFDLGIGILFPFVRDERRRDVMVNSIAPVWDGNETWLVLGGGGLFAVFPLAYSLVLTALYAPLIAMLLALVFRGVAFEFRFRDPPRKRLWDLGFAGGSILATFCQGVVLGAFVQGIAVEGRSYAGGWWDWLTLFSLFTGFSLCLGYALLGAGWLVIKTEGDLQKRCRRLMLRLAPAVLLAIAAISIWTPILNARIAARWFSWPNLALLSPVPLLVLLVFALLYRALLLRRERQPFLWALALFVMAFAGLGVSFYPLIVPPDVTIWDAAAPDSSLGFLLIGAAVLLPIILAYTAHAYWVFRGKVRSGEGYH